MGRPPDGISSMIINGGTCMGTVQANLEGEFYSKISKDYPTPEDMGVPNNTIRSVAKLD
eukprot:m.5540 g.5540  ORF g.5540 m.5540 type:complete len:59 (+) comp13462_c0_seq2:1152-1328(+)